MSDHIALTKFTRFSGCGAKLGPELLDKALCGLSQPSYPQLLADYSSSEDCGVYQIDERRALIQTIDFFPPIVDDPFTFGRIAAANALSDIFAMGGTPLTAVSVVCFPKDTLELEYLRQISAGGLDALAESRTALVGGHSIEDPELKFGFSVTGIIDVDKVLYNNRAKVGQSLFLTKPIGTGLINTALRAGCASEASLREATSSMSSLNMYASRLLRDVSVGACTDVTGFGLLGHGCEMIQDSECGLEIYIDRIPTLPDVHEYIDSGLIPEGTYRNKGYRGPYIEDLGAVDPDTIDLLFDPQTSGGLLFTCDAEQDQRLFDSFSQAGLSLWKIGRVTDNKGRIRLS